MVRKKNTCIKSKSIDFQMNKDVTINCQLWDVFRRSQSVEFIYYVLRGFKHFFTKATSWWFWEIF